MSSETSTSEASSGVAAASLPPWQLFALAGLVGATIVVFVARGQSPAAIILLSLVVFAAAAAGAAALRTLLPFTSTRAFSSTPIVAGRTRGAIEREKTLVLRSIKELEFDYAMGKLSDQDFSEMGARLRLRAGGLLRQLDVSTDYAAQIEKELSVRLAAAGMPGPSAASSLPGTEGASVPRFCSQCGTALEPAARFCSQCGHRLVSA
jgi:hypothetical protein